ncbi:MAG: GGDEF domain-containing protein [Edaphobacter sp.]|uniref:GGDEF domain-containing protein n=1 Tax=Edaphobacter sp. TaxID=1934404 RepID=UPI00238BA3D5|nr:GGDEF domain-containing protein [Edaphobacter sp.]MDE1178663.1 GGDEF domain-containing protein [Edaphobacter sp.]
MLLDATLLIQDIQLLCFTIVFGVLAMQRWSDRVRRWLWYSFLANTMGATLDILGHHMPAWFGNGINEEMIPLSYALLNVSLVYFNRRSRRPIWISVLILAAGLPFFLAWSSSPNRIPSNTLADLLIALVCMVTAELLFNSREKSTRAPRLLMGLFLAFFVAVELARVWVVFVRHVDPDAAGSRLAIVSVVTYIVNVSLLPLAYVWMIQARQEWELVQQSMIDPLTGVLNRRGLEQTLDRELARNHRFGDELTVAMLDLDHFKNLNDQYGHAVGDTILMSVAQLIAAQLRGTDVIGRFGGEEFVLLFPNADLDQSGPVLERLCEILREETSLLPSIDIRVTASFGATSLRGRRGVTAAALLNEADIALYRAKANGRDRVCFF